MPDTAVCPYFDHDEDVCDVGCGYISSHDASMIIKFCSCRYQECHKFRELSDRIQLPEPALQRARPVRPAGQLDNLPVLGLFSYSMTAACYALDKLPVFSFNLHLLAIILMLGAAGQISAGLNALKRKPLRAIAFTGFGLFWLSILALDILPRAGYGAVPGRLALMGYFAMWGGFGLVICQGFDQLTRTCRTVFAMMAAFLMMLAMAHAAGSAAILHGAALVGLTSSLPGIYLGLRYIGGELAGLLHLEEVKSGKLRS